VTDPERFDAIRRRFIAALAKRAQGQPEPIKRVLEGKLRQALAEYAQRFEQAQSEARQVVTRTAEQFPGSADTLRQLFVAGDLPGLRRYRIALEGNAKRTPLGELIDHIAQQAAQELPGDRTRHDGADAELRSLRHFRDTWSKLSVDRAVALALAAGPANAGPLNSQSLMLQALQAMREIAPDYLNRFMAYADALQWLEQAHGGGAQAKITAGRGDGRKRRKAKRAESA
jgi:hypothetical protein